MWLKFFTNRAILILLAIAVILMTILLRQYTEFTFNLTVFYLSTSILIFNILISGLLFERAKLASYFLLFTADLILILNIFLVLGLNK